MIKIYGVLRGLVRGFILQNPVPYLAVKYGVNVVPGFYGVFSIPTRENTYACTYVYTIYIYSVVETKTPGNPVTGVNFLLDFELTHGVLKNVNPVKPRKARGFIHASPNSSLLDPASALIAAAAPVAGIKGAKIDLGFTHYLVKDVSNAPVASTVRRQAPANNHGSPRCNEQSHPRSVAQPDASSVMTDPSRT